MLEPRTMNYLELLERIRDVVLQNMELTTKLKDNFEIEGNEHLETLLFYAMRGLKPVGVNRYFMMTAIHDRFSSYIKKELPSKLIWDYLESLYDMAVLHESEIIPFPNEEVDFELPEEFDEMIKEKYGVTLPRPPKDEDEALKSSPNIKTLKKLAPSKLKQAANTTGNAKNAFQTPVSGKLSKNNLGSRSEPKPSSAEVTVKGKQESPFPARVNKASRASSPFTTKNSKSETASSTSESSTSTPVSTSKKSKMENHSSSSTKKTPKNDSTPSSNAQKKHAKAEPSSSSKHAKTETPDNKKSRTDKEQSNKKGKGSLPAENSASKKSSKSDGKKIEAEHSRKSSDNSSKHKEKERSSTKGSKHDDLESSHSSGSRKSSSGKVDSSDKKKKQRVEESAKKGTPPAKRRRTVNS